MDSSSAAIWQVSLPGSLKKNIRMPQYNPAFWSLQVMIEMPVRRICKITEPTQIEAYRIKGKICRPYTAGPFVKAAQMLMYTSDDRCITFDYIL
jgi:hypothetical protein